MTQTMVRASLNEVVGEVLAITSYATISQIDGSTVELISKSRLDAYSVLEELKMALDENGFEYESKLGEDGGMIKIGRRYISATC